MAKITLPQAEKSLWQAVTPGFHFPSLQQDLEADVVIVGGGISGLTCAYLLKQSGLRVVVIEKDMVAAGSTGKTTGKVTSQHNLIYDKLQRRMGRPVAAAYAAANQEALTRIREIVRVEHIDCDWQDDDNYVYTTQLDQVSRFEREASVARDLGLPATLEGATPLPFAVTAAVKFAGQAKFDARKYVLGLARLIQDDGSYVFENTRALALRDGKPCRVRTARGIVKARWIIVATKVPTFPLVARAGYGLLEYPQFSYLVAGKLNRDIGGMYISPDPDHYSILPFTLEGQRYLMVGGQNHLPGVRVNFKARHERLAEYAAQHFGVQQIDYRWKAWDYLAYDNLPLAGRVYPWSRHMLTVTALMKWGLTNTMVCAQILHDEITGRINPYAKIFNSVRTSPIKQFPLAAPEILKNL